MCITGITRKSDPSDRDTQYYGVDSLLLNTVQIRTVFNSPLVDTVQIPTVFPIVSHRPNSPSYTLRWGSMAGPTVP